MKNIKRNNQSGFGALFLLAAMCTIGVFGSGSVWNFGDNNKSTVAQSETWGGEGNKVSLSGWLKGEE